MNIVKRIGLLGAIATIVLAALFVGASIALAQGGAPTTPDQPKGTAVFIGGVDLEWNEVPGADSYDVQLYRNGWIDLPGDGIEIALYGAGAIISGLNHEGSSYWFQVRANNAHGSSDWSPYSFMAPTSQFDSGGRARPSNVPASGAPVITGTAQVGETLTADTTDITDENGLARVEFRFQWVSNDGSADTDIVGATDSTYTLTANGEGKTVNVRVSFTDRGGYAESLTSAGTEPVASSAQATPIPTQETTPEPAQNSPATGAPAITGTAQVGETLTADTSGIADADGLANVSYSYQWVSNDGTSDTNIAGATDSGYTLSAADEGKVIKVKVSFTDDEGNSESRTSPATTAVSTDDTVVGICDRTEQVREKILAQLPGVDDCAAVTVTHLSSITELVFVRIRVSPSAPPVGPGIQSLMAHDFEGLSNLEHLDLGGNGLSKLPDDIFVGLTNLNTLWLDGNDLTADGLPTAILDDLPSLETLGLSENNPTAVYGGVLENLSGLKKLALSRLDLSEMPEGLFDGLDSLEELLLMDANISASSLPDGIFDNLTNLQHLNMNDNDFGGLGLPGGLFKNLSSLRSLTMHRSRVGPLHEDAFEGPLQLGKAVHVPRRRKVHAGGCVRRPHQPPGTELASQLLSFNPGERIRRPVQSRGALPVLRPDRRVAGRRL